jgi:tetratricopeptide (TPR) repeat protein
MLEVLARIEGAGIVHLADDGLLALLAMLPSIDASPPECRAAHVLAQRGRVLRTLGRLDEALDAYRSAATAARQAGDAWLVARCEIGAGNALSHRGNYPAAREAFNRVLKTVEEGSVFSGAAHHGLLLAAIAAKQYDDAFAHGWHLFEAAGDDTASRVDVLTTLADLCLKAGRPLAALRAAQVAISLGPLPRFRLPLLGSAVLAAEALSESRLADEYALRMESLIPLEPNRWAAAQGCVDLAKFYLVRGDHDRVRAITDSGLSLSRAHGFHEFVWQLEEIAGDAASERTQNIGMAAPLGEATHAILEDLMGLPIAPAIAPAVW